MNGRIIVAKPLYVALAQRKEDRKAQLTAQYMQRVSGMRMQQMGQVNSNLFRKSTMVNWIFEKIRMQKMFINFMKYAKFRKKKARSLTKYTASQRKLCNF